ncbi:MAG: hypothetical protein MI892_18705 [Desulfobacterales bacterium]|nr:hypothetical protein [Desulfobacterales bacterium]
MSYSRYTSKMAGRVAAASMAPACISAIFGKRNVPKGLRPGFLGEELFIHKNYVQFRPFNPDMNVSKTNRKGFKPDDEKTRADFIRKNHIHYEYKKNLYENRDDLIDDIDNHRVVKVPGQKELELVDFKPEKTPLQKRQQAAQIGAESRIYAQKHNERISREKRGIITKVSRKSSIRLKQFLASILDLGLWVDFTFPDDVMVGKTLAERRDFANECLKKLKRFIHKLGLKEIWKKEFTTRKSGKLKGLYLPHYHIALAGLSRQQEKDWQMLCIKILTKWIQIIGTDDDNALVVACHRKSFRKIHCSRQAISYIGKYFSKTNEVEDEDGEIISIGRAWGYARVLKEEIPDPIHLYVNKGEAIKIRRFMKRYKKLKPNEKFIGAYEQITNGYSTFLFADETTLLRFLMSIGVDILQDSGVPF